MKRARVLAWALIPLLLGIPGCDIAVGVYFATKKKSSHGSSAVPSTPPPDLTYTVYVNTIAPGSETTEQGALIASGGMPGPSWVKVGSANSTIIWPVPVAAPASVNAVLVQPTAAQDFNIDCFERLDANDSVIEVAGATFWDNTNNTTTNPANATGSMDGIVAVTDSTIAGHKPFLFTAFGSPVSRFRVRLWGAAPSSGDCVALHTKQRTGSLVVGGAAIDSLGRLYTTFRENPNGDYWMLPYQANGTESSLVSLATGATASAGSCSVAVDGNDNIFVVATVGTGQIQTQKYDPATLPSAKWTTSFSGVGANQVGPGGIAVMSNAPLSAGGNGTVIFVAGGQTNLLSNKDHYLTRFDDLLTSASSVWTQAAAVDANNTYWSAVTTRGITDVLSTGSLTASNGKQEVLTQKSAMNNGAVVWPSPATTTGGSDPSITNNGSAIGLDGAGLVYVGGYFGSSTNGRNRVLLRYAADGSSVTPLFQSTLPSDDEILGLAVDTDGTSYVTGYVTVAGQGQDVWIARFPPGGSNPVWTATFHGNVGDDQGISVCLSGSFVTVVCQETITGPKTAMRIFKFVK